MLFPAQGNMILGWCKKIPKENAIRTLCIGINADPNTDNDKGILGGSPQEVKPNNDLQWKIDLHFVRRVAGIVCELALVSDGPADGAELELEIAGSKDNSDWGPVTTKTLKFKPQPKDSNLVLRPHDFAEHVDARYFKISCKRPQFHYRLSVAMALQYHTDTSSQSVTTIEDIPSKMSETWHSHNGTESLLYYAAKFEHRSCRRLAQILGMLIILAARDSKICSICHGLEIVFFRETDRG